MIINPYSVLAKKNKNKGREEKKDRMKRWEVEKLINVILCKYIRLNLFVNKMLKKGTIKNKVC